MFNWCYDATRSHPSYQTFSISQSNFDIFQFCHRQEKNSQKDHNFNLTSITMLHIKTWA